MTDWDAIRYFLEVARTQRASAAAQRLGVRHSTVTRRIRSLELDMGITLFEKSRASGFSLTEEGLRFFTYAEQVESALLAAREALSGSSQGPTGHLRIGSTEGFGSTILTPLMVDFQRRHPGMTLDIMPVPRYISLSKREADIAIALERPQRGPYVCTKLADYSLKLYGTQPYLDRQPPIRQSHDLAQHRFVGYVDELLFTDRLRYLDDLAPAANVVFRSTSVQAQYQAALQGQALAILPCFLAAQDPRLIPILEQDIHVTRSFWMYCHEDLRRTRRVMALWNYLKQAIELNRDLLQGDSRTLRTPPEGWMPSYSAGTAAT
ncbi:LysR family transcriptional regulator [Castellaniella sp.]|uniref:LysR family transcriptional regulator n=1 Tax=Castellaniella sp. TaxID=1955812 RepID=UPI002AFDEF0E|nr:LysR family transcriptional regulator [Castellaniella sp.]